MISVFDNQKPTEIYHEVTEGAVLLIFLTENTNNQYRDEITLILDNFNKQSDKQGNSIKIVWYLLPFFDKPLVKSYWQRYNPSLLVPFFVFTKPDGTNANLAIEGIPTIEKLTSLRNLIS
jgi:hypothetical protein